MDVEEPSESSSLVSGEEQPNRVARSEEYLQQRGTMFWKKIAVRSLIVNGIAILAIVIVIMKDGKSVELDSRASVDALEVARVDALDAKTDASGAKTSASNTEDDPNRVLCNVHTDWPDEERLKLVMQTWGKHCEGLVFWVTKNSDDIPQEFMGATVINVKNFVHPTGEAFPEKFVLKRQVAAQWVILYHAMFDPDNQEFLSRLEHPEQIPKLQGFSWFSKCDTDTFILPENMRWMVQKFDRDDDDSFFGDSIRGNVGDRLNYMHGGSNYIIGRGVLKKFGPLVNVHIYGKASKRALPDNPDFGADENSLLWCNPFALGKWDFEDVLINECLRTIGIHPADAGPTVDAQGREFLFANKADNIPTLSKDTYQEGDYWWTKLRSYTLTGKDHFVPYISSFHRYKKGDEAEIRKLYYLLYDVKIYRDNTESSSTG